ncbi:MAG: ribosome silencing factor [Leptotrichia hofstadii]
MAAFILSGIILIGIAVGYASKGAKKAQDIKIYDMRGKSPFFDYSILCTGSSSRNIEAIATDIKKSLENVKSVEGLDEANWVLIDAGDLIISVFSKDAREYYRLDDFYNGVNEENSEIDENDGE